MALPECPNRFPEHYFCDVCGDRKHTPEERMEYGNPFDQELAKRQINERLQYPSGSTPGP